MTWILFKIGQQSAPSHQ